MKLAVFPFDSKSQNEYLNQMLKAFTLAYPGLEILDFNPFNIKKVKDIDVCWLNWYENLYSNSISVLKELSKKLIRIVLIKIFRKRIIATFHNKQPHEMKYQHLNMVFFKWYFRMADNIIILCEESKSIIKNIIGENHMSKVILIPHPKYDCTPRIWLSDSIKPPFSVLFFGLLRPYKNIEMVIELAKENQDINFVVAGKPLTHEYGLQLLNLCKGIKNITLDLKYQSDKDIDFLMDKTSVLLLPYNLNSSLNSGVLMYALSKGVNVIIPEIGGVKDIKLHKKIYTYKYQNDSEHKESVSKMLSKAKSDYNNKYSEFVTDIKMLRQDIATHNSITEISTLLTRLNLGNT